MKKLLKSCTFWFVLFGILVLIYNPTGHDDKNIVMIGLNPLLCLVCNTSAFCVAAEEFPYVWHLQSLISMVIYGLALDGVKLMLKKRYSGVCYTLTALLTAGFFMKLVKDYVLYTATLNSAPFDLWVAVDGILFLLPAAVVALVGWILHKRTEAEKA